MILISLIIASNVIAVVIGWCLTVLTTSSIKRSYLKKVPLSLVKAMYADAYVAGKLNSEQIAALFELLD